MSDATDEAVDDYEYPTVPLSRAFACRYGQPVIDRVDPRLYRLRYFHECMRCDYCGDSCCQYGADVDVTKVEALLAEADRGLETFVGRPRDRWFMDFVEPEPEYPGGRYTRTQVEGERCVFLNRGGRGCKIHSYALERGQSVYDLKPLVCCLFPVSFAKGAFIPPLEIQDESLVCFGDGPTLYRSAREDIRYYFGDELVAEMDALEAAALAEEPPMPQGRVVPLPLADG